MIHGYHATFGAYGAWFPNDPRGSKSRFVGGLSLFENGGRVTAAEGVPSEQLSSTDRRRLEALRGSLKRPAVQFNDDQCSFVGRAIGDFARDAQVVVWALAVMPCHVHLVFARCGRKSEDIVEELKDDVHRKMESAQCLPNGCDDDAGPWARGRWIEYLDSEEAIEAAIVYTEQNPIDEGRPRQDWPFVQPFQGIPSNIVSYND